MKRLFATMTIGIFLSGFFQVAQAQTEKGSWLLGGSGSFQHLKQSVNLTGNQIPGYFCRLWAEKFCPQNNRRKLHL